MKTIQNVDSISSLPGNHLQVRLPHITADKFKRQTPVLAEPAEEPQQGPDRAFLTDPQQPLTVAIDLVYQRQVPVTSLPGDLVNADRLNTRQILMREKRGRFYFSLHNMLGSSVAR
jgi:hypothetical protein